MYNGDRLVSESQDPARGPIRPVEFSDQFVQCPTLSSGLHMNDINDNIFLNMS